MIDSAWNTSLEQLKAGYIEEAEHYTCLCCGKQVEKGLIYPEGGLLYEAGRFMRHHIAQEHGSVFEHLVRLDKEATGLTDLQRRILELLYLGKSDAEVQKALGIGSASTIRNHRFLLREKERQAKAFLAMMELLRAQERRPAAEAPPEKPVASIPRNDQRRRALMTEVSGRFETGRTYTEKEVNQVLAELFADHVTARRYLVDYGLLRRQPDGSRYWRPSPTDEQEEPSMMPKRAELKRQAKEIKTEAGVFQIRNTKNGKLLVESTRNLKTINGQQFTLRTGGHINKTLQREWDEYGEAAFAFEVLEVLEKPETGYFDEKDELKKLKEKWLEQLQPYGDRGYNTPPVQR